MIEACFYCGVPGEHAGFDACPECVDLFQTILGVNVGSPMWSEGFREQVRDKLRAVIEGVFAAVAEEPRGTRPWAITGAIHRMNERTRGERIG
jgi:hypothetical protein